jgi:hypothetical protein
MEMTPEEVTTRPEEVPKVDTTQKVGGELDLLNQSHKVLHVWKDVYKVEKDNADDAYYYAEQLWCEDKVRWAYGKCKVLHGEWTIKHFDKEMESLKNNKVDEICKKLEGPHKDIQAAHECMKESLGPLLLMYLFGKELDHLAEHGNLCHEYQHKLKQLYKDAKTEFQLLCAWPKGTLMRVRLFWDTYLKENDHVIAQQEGSC